MNKRLLMILDDLVHVFGKEERPGSFIIKNEHGKWYCELYDEEDNHIATGYSEQGNEKADDAIWLCIRGALERLQN